MPGSKPVAISSTIVYRPKGWVGPVTTTPSKGKKGKKGGRRTLKRKTRKARYSRRH